MTKSTILLLTTILLILSCYSNKNDDAPEPITEFTNGFFIVNQGIDIGRDGSISFYDRGRKEVANKIYENKNDLFLEGTLTSMRNLTGRSYIVQHQLGNISVTDTESMGLLEEIPDFQLPRYLLPVSNNRAYVSQWGADGGAGSIQILDLLTNSITGEISTPGGAEQMLRLGDFVYLTHTGGFFLDSVVTKIDINTDAIVKTIEVGISPQSLQFDANGDLWVLAKGLETFSEQRSGTLAKIVNDEVALSISVPLGTRDLVIDNNRTTLYYINGQNNRIYAHYINKGLLELAPFSDLPVTALELDRTTNLLIGMDSKNFQIEGTLLLFDENGEVMEEHTVGYVPAEIVF